jgi:hypothetical protein
MSARAAFLIIAAAVVLHLSVLATCILFAGYFAFDGLDQWLANRARRRALDEAIDDETSGWEPDPDHEGWESKGGATRVRLPDKEQIIVTRIAHLLRRIR